MFTKSEVLEQSPSEELKLEFSNPIWIATSPPQTKPLKLNPLKCITNNSLKPFQETTSVSILKILLLKKSKEETSPLMLRETPPELPKASSLRLSSLTTPDQSKTDTPPSLIATPPTSPSSSTKSPKKSTEELVNPLKTSPKTSNPEMPAFAS